MQAIGRLGWNVRCERTTTLNSIVLHCEVQQHVCVVMVVVVEVVVVV
jgi:hypothetical protein